MARKMTRIIDEDVMGMSENGEVMINLTKLWDKHQNEENFAEEFGLTYTHELLHVILEGVCEHHHVCVVSEEKIVRTLLDEEWNETLEEQYAGDE